ncbi:MAG TPA: polymer-forming cytoskeletal protein [Candidatus Polarisedimenticolia bacterium]|nr:polymer-forming cytoskeletal protein [Candidatus Polarisedimenticolia bacterium]
MRTNPTLIPLILVLASAAAVTPPAFCVEGGESKAGKTYKLPEGQTHKGDLYLYSGTVQIGGVQNGDVTAFTESLVVTGSVTGDMYVMAETITIDGKVGDSARFFGKDVHVNGTIEGDLIVFGGDVTVDPKARVTGDVSAFAGHVVIDGTVDGSLKATGGSVTVGGTIGENAKIKSDEVEIGPNARIGGDLSYTSRNRLDLEGKGIVAGHIDYMESKEKVKKGVRSAVSRGVKWIWFTSAGLVVGLAALAVFRRVAPAIQATLTGDAARSAGFGFMAVIIVPVAAVISCILIVTIPLAALVLVVYLVAVYLAKVPVGVWLGQRVLKATGQTDPSPYWSLTTGLLLLYVTFSIPFLGCLVWFACLFLGLGAIILGGRAYVLARRASTPMPPGPVPPVSGSVPPVAQPQAG